MNSFNSYHKSPVTTLFKDGKTEAQRGLSSLPSITQPRRPGRLALEPLPWTSTLHCLQPDMPAAQLLLSDYRSPGAARFPGLGWVTGHLFLRNLPAPRGGHWHRCQQLCSMLSHQDSPFPGSPDIQIQGFTLLDPTLTTSSLISWKCSALLSQPGANHKSFWLLKKKC